jgi:hypothetical protein
MSTPTLCLCGCGQPVQLEGRPARFRPGHNMKTPEGRAAMAARSRRLRACGKLGISSRPGGGRKIDREGYLLVKASGHPQADCQGYVREHRLAMERHIGRPLASGEVVHARRRKPAVRSSIPLWKSLVEAGLQSRSRSQLQAPRSKTELRAQARISWSVRRPRANGVRPKLLQQRVRLNLPRDTPRRLRLGARPPSGCSQRLRPRPGFARSHQEGDAHLLGG